jgi:hypothetical protein
MAYDRYEQRRGWREREPRDGDERFAERGYAGNRGRFEPDRGGFDRDRDRDERGWFERAGDQLSSWFGDDDGDRRPRGEDYERFERNPRFRDEAYRRPYTGRFGGRQGFGDRFGPDRVGTDRGQLDRGASQRDFTGAASGVHDPHYSEWRSRQIDALDRDYDEYRRENQARFEDEFSAWRGERQTKRQMMGTIREHMEVVGSDDQHVGKVDRIAGDRIILAKNDADAHGTHHSLSCSALDRVEGDRVVLNCTADKARSQWRDDRTERALFEREDQGEAGPHILGRSFSGTY